MNDQVIHKWPALTEEEKKFIAFWEKARDKRHKWTYHLINNISIGILFSAPMALFFFVEAPRHRGLITHGDLVLIMIGIFLIAVFYAILRGYTRWDQYESHYTILKMKDESRASDTISGDPEA